MPNNVALGNNLELKSLPSLKWRRVVFKISGATLSGNCQSIDTKVAMQIAREIATACWLGLEPWSTMASIMNSMLLQSALEKLGVQSRIQSAIVLPEVAEPYSRSQAIRHLEKGKGVILVALVVALGILSLQLTQQQH
ncbi:hypothetical protein CRYUN_Cryun01aG0070800 [Craigia yunnanensis]